MWNYYKTVVINSATAEDGHDMFFESEVFSPEQNKRVKAASVWRNGQYDLAKVGKITKTVGYPGENAVLEINCEGIIPTQTLVEGGNPEPEFGLYQLSFNVEMDGKFLSDWATPNYKSFYKPIVVGLDLHTENAKELAAYIAEQINLALPENNKFIKVDAKDGKVVIAATDNYMILKPENFKFEKYEVVGCDTCLGEYVEKSLGEKVQLTTPGKQPFATGTWLLENQRLPNSNNFRYFGFNDEMPIAGAIYVQYSFDYVSDRPGLGGHSGVGQGITAITNHTFFVIESAAKDFETVFADAKGGFAGDDLEA